VHSFVPGLKTTVVWKPQDLVQDLKQRGISTTWSGDFPRYLVDLQKKPRGLPTKALTNNIRHVV
jgi:hypothetical protein